MKITHRSDPPEVMDAILETNRMLLRKIDEYEEWVRKRVDAEEAFEGSHAKKVIEILDTEEINITTAKMKANKSDRIRHLKKDFELAKGIEDVFKKKIRSLETNVESLRSILSFQKTERSNQ